MSFFDFGRQDCGCNKHEHAPHQQHFCVDIPAGPRGERGPMGPQGPAGRDGRDGCDGNHGRTPSVCELCEQISAMCRNGSMSCPCQGV